MFHGVLDRPKKDQAAINPACLLTFTSSSTANEMQCHVVCGTVYRYLENLYSYKVYTCYIKCNTFLVGMVGCFIHAHHDHQTQRNEDTAYDLWGEGGGECEGRRGECEGEKRGLN